ncbi:hypothetical protein KC359_g195 [Hortaea werneckii]|nr:hypothetical protein KC359_g195 [Hortaea werneckii]
MRSDDSKASAFCIGTLTAMGENIDTCPRESPNCRYMCSSSATTAHLQAYDVKSVNPLMTESSVVFAPPDLSCVMSTKGMNSDHSGKEKASSGCDAVDPKTAIWKFSMVPGSIDVPFAATRHASVFFRKGTAASSVRSPSKPLKTALVKERVIGIEPAAMRFLVLRAGLALEEVDVVGAVERVARSLDVGDVLEQAAVVSELALGTIPGAATGSGAAVRLEDPALAIAFLLPSLLENSGCFPKCPCRTADVARRLGRKLTLPGTSCAQPKQLTNQVRQRWYESLQVVFASGEELEDLVLQIGSDLLEAVDSRLLHTAGGVGIAVGVSKCNLPVDERRVDHAAGIAEVMSEKRVDNGHLAGRSVYRHPLVTDHTWQGRVASRWHLASLAFEKPECNIRAVPAREQNRVVRTVTICATTGTTLADTIVILPRNTMDTGDLVEACSIILCFLLELLHSEDEECPGRLPVS